MTRQLVIYGVLGIAATVVAFASNRKLFDKESTGAVTPLEVVYYVVGVTSLVLGWYFNVRYTHAYPHKASYVDYTKMLFSNWAADSAAQDYTVVNVLLLPLWTITDGRRRAIRFPWIFFVMSLFTSLAFSMAVYLAFVERQVRYAGVRATSSSTA